MKKLLIALCLILISTSISYANIQYNNWNIFDHTNCFSSRWQYIASDNNIHVLYDTSTVEEKNHFNPFADRIVIMWIAMHLGNNHTTFKYLYEINIDKKTQKVLSAPSTKYKYLNVERPIVADSLDECILIKATNIYSK